MGRRRAANKMKVNNQKPSSSSNGNRKRTMNKTDKDNGQKEKKSKKETKTKVQKSSVNDLPPEMLMKVLKNVDSKSLVGCRLVNKKWNGIASEILQSRPDLELQFNYSDKNGTANFLCKDEEQSLFDFMECFKNSKSFPVAHFCFSQVDSSSFDQKDLIEFISDFGENIKGLKLSIESAIRKDDFMKLTEKIRDLLLIKLPELEKFGFQSKSLRIPNSPALKLFPISTENSTSKTTIRLPHLKMFYFDDLTFSRNTGIVTDLLCASVNLQKLEPFYKDEPYTNLGMIFELLESLGKLPCLEAARIEPVGLLSQFKLSAPLALKLKSVDLDAQFLYRNEKFWSDATVFLSLLFESSKDTLRDLKMDSLGFLKDLQFPKFSQLTSLSTREAYAPQDPLPESLFPPQVNPVEIFPALRFIRVEDVPWSTAFPNEQNTRGLSTLETLIVTGADMTKTTIAEISLLCPNLKNFEIVAGNGALQNFPEVGRAIWTHLKKLQYLEIYVDADNPGGVFPAYDSCITGFSKKDSRRLYNLLLADKLLKKCGSQLTIPQSEFEPERKFPSILDLKDLEFFQLEVLCCSWDENLKIKPNLTKKGPTCVSEKCALDLMDNLVYNIDKQVHYFESSG